MAVVPITISGLRQVWRKADNKNKNKKNESSFGLNRPHILYLLFLFPPPLAQPFLPTSIGFCADPFILTVVLFRLYLLWQIATKNLQEKNTKIFD